MNRIPSTLALGLNRSLPALVLLLALPAPLIAQNRLEAWGQGFGAYGVPLETGWTQLSAGGGLCVGLRGDGSIEVWGASYDGWVIRDSPPGSDFVQVSAGGNHAIALRSDGSLTSWGEDDYGCVSNTPTGTGFIEAQAGFHVSFALRSDGSIVAWGSDYDNILSDLPAGTAYSQLTSAGGAALAFRPDGSIVAWGSDSDGQVSNAPTVAGFTQIAGGPRHCMALRQDGSIVSWGFENANGTISNTPVGAGFMQVAAGYQHSVALRSDGSIQSWGEDWWAPEPPSNVGFSQIAAGGQFTVAILEDNSGTPNCFGDGTGENCPCSANGMPGAGCASSSTGGAILSGVGNAAYGHDTLALQVTGIPGDKPGLFLTGTGQLNGGLGNALGDGLLCIGGQTLRSQIQVSSGGSSSFRNFHGNPLGSASYGPGVSANYQYWYRDNANGCTGAGFNLSNAWTVTWVL